MYIRSVFPRSTFGSSFSFLAVAFRFAMGEEEGRVGGERRREKRGESTGCCRRAGTGFHALKYLSVGSTRARRSGCAGGRDRKSTRLNSSHVRISYAVFCLKKKTQMNERRTTQRSTQNTQRE